MSRRIIGCTCMSLLSMAAWAGVSGVYDANHVLLGEYAESVTVIHSIYGYRFSVDGTSGGVGRMDSDIAGATYDSAYLIYSSGNCTGQAYISTSATSGQAGGIVFTAGEKGIYYVAKAPAASTTAIASSYNGSSCSPITPGLFAVVPAAPNDPLLTGVQNAPFAPPFHLEMVPLSQFFRIFQSGFESSYLESQREEREQQVA